MTKGLFVIGVGPGSPVYLTDIAKNAVKKSQYIIGYKYTLNAIEDVIDRNLQKVYEVTMKNQEEMYQQVFKSMSDGEFCLVPFTGDVNFSESEVVDRLLQIFGDENVEIIPGISSIQIASSRSKVPLDKSYIVTFHVTGDIEIKKLELIKAVIDGKSVILLPRPWHTKPEKNFMPSEIAIFLRKNGIDTSKIKVWVFENLTTEKETVFRSNILDLEGKQFSDLSVMVIDQYKRQTYLDFD
ncbi:MAG: precorrin-6y C5,15-methyltransferase (decarboxylating) subunit CbiE [Nitrososphaeraceae archaeon]|nr:precorrin-6y C5,15-methyltransferase (decarboxylating) subunit CbiE [Nitrososphaeraceae archaeon]